MKKEKTFADRAKEIKNKYTRSEWDMLERKDMMQELSKLREEQEQVRAAMGIADHADAMDQQMANGGVYDGYNNTQELPRSYKDINPNYQFRLFDMFTPQKMVDWKNKPKPYFDKTKRTWIYPDEMFNNSSVGQIDIPYGEKIKGPVEPQQVIQDKQITPTQNKIGNINNPVVNPLNANPSKNYFPAEPAYDWNIAKGFRQVDVGIPAGPTSINKITTGNIDIPSVMPKTDLTTKTSLAGAPKAGNKYKPMSASGWASGISAGISAIGDIAGMINAKKNMPKNVTLPRVAPYNINLQAQREALQRGYNTASNTMLRNSRDVSSPGNAYANQIAGISALTDSLGTQMGQSYMNEANTNAQMGQQRNMVNADIGSKEALTNAQLQQQNAQIMSQYINSLAETVPSAMRDYRQQVSEVNMMNTMGKDYGLYERYNPNMTFMQKMRRGILGPEYELKNRYYAQQNQG